MKKFLLSLATFALGLSAYAGEVTFDFATNNYGLPAYNEDLSNNSPYVENGTSIELNGVKITFSGEKEEAWRMWSDGLRSMNKSSKNPIFTVTTTNGEPVSFVTWSVNSGVKFAEGSFGEGLTSNDAISMWEGPAESVTFVNVGNANAAVKTITVGYGTDVDIPDQPELSEFSVTEALAYLNSGNSGEAIVYGVVTSVGSFNSTYGSLTYNIGDAVDALETIQVYAGFGVNGEKFSGQNDVVVGSKVQVQGTLKLYTNSEGVVIPEFDMNSIMLSYQLPDDYEEPEAPEGILSVADALDWISNGYSGIAQVKGIITDIQEISLQYGNATYTLKDSETASEGLLVYRGYYLDGEKFTAEDQLAVGNEVVVEGSLVDYNGTYEFTTGSKILVLNQSAGVEAIDAANNRPAVYYNLQGMKVNNPTKGLYIINGKKVVIK